jgi:hypothetical protein
VVLCWASKDFPSQRYRSTPFRPMADTSTCTIYSEVDSWARVSAQTL